MKSVKSVKIPKIHIRLETVFWLILFVIVSSEIYYLYSSLFAAIKSPEYSSPAAEAPSTRAVNLKLYNNAVEWLKQRENFTIPPYSFQKGTSGRSNPMAQY